MGAKVRKPQATDDIAATDDGAKWKKVALVAL